MIVIATLLHYEPFGMNGNDLITIGYEPGVASGLALGGGEDCKKKFSDKQRYTSGNWQCAPVNRMDYLVICVRWPGGLSSARRTKRRFIRSTLSDRC